MFIDRKKERMKKKRSIAPMKFRVSLIKNVKQN